MKKLLSLGAIAALLLSGCTSDSGNCVRLSLNAKYCLSVAPGPFFDTEQASTVSYGGNTVHMITRIQSGEDGLRFAGITPLGQTLMQVIADKHGVKSQLPPGTAGKLDGALFVALVQLATWPADEVRQGLRGGLTLDEQTHSRTILENDKALLTVTWEGNQPPFDKLSVEIPGAQVKVDSRTLDKDDTE